MKKLIALLLALVMVFALAACGEKPADDPAAPSTPADPSTPSTPADPAEPQIINIAVDGDCGSIDCYGITGAGYFPVYLCYQESLWENDGSDPSAIATSFVLAESLEVINDLEYVIKLREGVTFSNGSPFTAEDVIFTFEYVLSLPSRSYYLPVIDMEKTVAEDDHTLRLFLTRYDKTQLPSLQDIPILDKETFNAEESATRPIGTGPYVVTDYVVNSHVTLEGRDDYWGGDVAFDTVTFKNIPEASQKVTALETGEVDVICQAPYADVAYLESLANAQVVTKVCSQQSNIYFNCSSLENSPMASKEARWAVAHAIDRQAIVDVAYNGIGVPASAIFSSGASDFIPEVANLHDTYAIGYDMDLAKKYADESGLTGKTVRICTNGTGVYPVIAQIIQQSLIELGIDATVTNYDTATISNMLAAEDDSWDIICYYITNPSGVGLDMIYGVLGKFNWCRSFELPETEYFRSGAEDALATSNVDAYNDKMIEYVKTVEEFCPYFGLVDITLACAADSDIKDFGFYSFSYHNVGEWSR